MATENSDKFWAALANLRRFLNTNPSLISQFRREPGPFLVSHKLDVTVALDDVRTTTLSEILATAGNAEQKAILGALQYISRRHLW